MKKKYSQWLVLSLALLLTCGMSLLSGHIPGVLTVGASDLAQPADGTAEGDAGPLQVYIGGMPFGVKFFTEGVLVVGFCDIGGEAGTSAKGSNPAKEAGLHVKDVITHVDGKLLSSAADLTQAVEHSQGRPLTLTVRRMQAPTRGAKGTGDKGTSLTLTVTPMFSKEENRYKTGIWVRDSGAGIGTVTFIIPSTRAFAGLGHGICDGDTGELIPIGRGQVTDVTVSGIDKGVSGDPGAIKGYFTSGKTGTLVGNTPCGVFGIFTTLPSGSQTLCPVATRQELKEGPATVLCTLDDGKVQAYDVSITAIDTSATGSKCFSITVTDPALIAKTGGIVQGMSGSPVLQEGKLVGAVTHVLISDPATGYGIFIDNMLREMPELLR